MTTLAQIKRRLSEYLTLEETDPQLDSVVKTFMAERDRMLEAFPVLALMSGLAESDAAERTATVIEAVLFDACWVDRFILDGDCVTNCRRKIATILSLLVDDSYKYVHDPNLRIWAVIRALAVERTARRGGIKKLFRSREVEMLERVISDCQVHVRDGRPLPSDLATRLRALESQGIFLPSDIYSVL